MTENNKRGETSGEQGKLRVDRVGVRVRCSCCYQTKAPRGRSAPFGCYCNEECPGYNEEPYPDPSLWPNESEVDFGYPAGNYYATAQEFKETRERVACPVREDASKPKDGDA